MNWDEFYKFIVQIQKHSDELHDGWVLNGDGEYCSYLSKKVYKNVGCTFLTFEYHIGYNISYSAPVLCFNAWTEDGCVVSMEECWKHLGIDSNAESLQFLTQMDHPVLKRPFLTVHPCKTEEILESFPKSDNYVASWLSVLAPFVKLDFATEYAQLT